MATIFVSYAREDRKCIEALVEDLEALGRDVWFDRAVTGGQKWWDEILARIRECDLFVFALTTASLDSVACKRECDYAARLLRPIVPVLSANDVSIDSLPSFLAQIHCVDYRRQDKESLKALARAITAHARQVPLPSPLPDPPTVPLSYLATVREQIDADGHLSFEAQSAIVIELKQGLRDSAKALDVRVLFNRLRLRRDLYAAVAAEIDSLLVAAQPSPSATPLSPTHSSTHNVWLPQKLARFFEPAKSEADPPSGLTQPQPTRALEANPEFGTTLTPPQGAMGSCPNCLNTIPLDSTECPICKALFGPESAWQVIPK